MSPGDDAIGLVLAAGAATRFGSPKQLAPFRGAPLIHWPVQALHAGGLDRVLVVLGAHADEIAAALPEAETVRADDWADGLSASLKAGVGAAASLGGARVVVVLGDQPLLSGAAVTRVLAASRDGHPVVRASYGAVPGHPTALAAETFAAVAQLTGDAGARKLTGYAQVEIPCDDVGSTVDIDTPADLVRWDTPGTQGAPSAADAPHSRAQRDADPPHTSG